MRWPGPRTLLRQALPWLVGLSILGGLLYRIPLEPLKEGLRTGPYHRLAAYISLQVVVTLAADGFATRAALRVSSVPCSFWEITLVRGATYLLGLLNYALGQSGIGFYLHRRGARPLRAAGIVLFLLVVNLGTLLLVGAAALAVWGGSLPGLKTSTVVALVAGLAALYLLVIGSRLKALAHREALAPLFQAGVRGHLRAAAGRLAHVAALILGHWGALWVWGIPVPLKDGLALMPVALLIAALPIAPVGLGTTQAGQVLLFSAYAPAPSAAGRAAAVLAFSLAAYALGFLAQCLLGLWCLARLRKGPARWGRPG